MVPGYTIPFSLFLFQVPWRSNCIQSLSVYICFRIPGGPTVYNPFQFISVSGSLEVQLYTIPFSLFLFQGPWRPNCIQSLSVYTCFRVPGGPTVYNPFQFIYVSGSLEVVLYTIPCSLYLFQGPWRSYCIQSLLVYICFRVPRGPTVYNPFQFISVSGSLEVQL